ncbi:MAG TPA: glucose 1-dehydrogenase [Bryobacteraceae bacterium]|nr:glucose 1-dehydrogenase [Bryobacteraceae bacterium]
MRAVAVFPERRQVGLIDHPEPHISSPEEVKIRILEVGVCGTDKEICSFEYGSSPEGSDYFVLGHESLGEVVDTGPRVEGLSRGDLVVGIVRHPCGSAACQACCAGHQDFCETAGYRERGIKSLHGFMTELVVDHYRNLHVLPAELRDVGVLVEPLTIAEKAFLELCAIDGRLPFRRSRRRAVVVGAGPVGLLGAMLLVERGYETWVYSRGRTPNPKAAIAEEIGAGYVSTEEMPPEHFAAKIGPIDVVYEAAGAVQTSFDVLQRLGPNGVFILTGVPRHGDPVSLDPSPLSLNLVMRNQALFGTVNAGPEAFMAAIRDLGAFLRRWPKAVRALITGRHPLEHFLDPVTGKAGGIKNVIVVQ